MLGESVFLHDSMKNPAPAITIITATAIVVTYSILPWPKGCLLSAGLPASFIPTIVTAEESTSLKLFTASNIIAIDPDNAPITLLNKTRSILTTIPIAPVLMIIFFLYEELPIIFRILELNKYRN